MLFCCGSFKKKDMSVNKLGEGLRGLEEERKEQLRRSRKSGTLAEMVVPKLKEKDLTRIQRTSKNRNRFWKRKFPKLANLLKIVGRSVCLKVFFECQKTVRSAVTGATTKNLNGSVPRTKENSMSVSSFPLTHIMWYAVENRSVATDWMLCVPDRGRWTLVGRSRCNR